MGKTNNKELNYHGRVSRDYRLRKVTKVSISTPTNIYQLFLCIDFSFDFYTMV